MSHSILIVDDEAGVRSALTRALRPEGYTLHVADGPRAAFEYLENEPVDLVISDHRMPRMTGLEFLARVRQDYPDTIRIMLTGQADLRTIIDAINVGEIHRFLPKPWDDEDLKLSIRICLANLDLSRENRRLLAALEEHARVIRDLADRHPGIFEVERDLRGAIVLSEELLEQGLTAKKTAQRES